MVFTHVNQSLKIVTKFLLPKSFLPTKRLSLKTTWKIWSYCIVFNFYFIKWEIFTFYKLVSNENFQITTSLTLLLMLSKLLGEAWNRRKKNMNVLWSNTWKNQAANKISRQKKTQCWSQISRRFGITHWSSDVIPPIVIRVAVICGLSGFSARFHSLGRAVGNLQRGHANWWARLWLRAWVTHQKSSSQSTICPLSPLNKTHGLRGAITASILILIDSSVFVFVWKHFTVRWVRLRNITFCLRASLCSRTSVKWIIKNNECLPARLGNTPISLCLAYEARYSTWADVDGWSIFRV